MYLNTEKVKKFVQNMNGATSNFQFLALSEEFGEVARCLIEDEDNDLLAELADLLVTVMTFAESADLLDSLEEAFDKKMDKNLLKKRFTAQGKLVS